MDFLINAWSILFALLIVFTVLTLLFLNRQIYALIFSTDKAKMNCSAGLAFMKTKSIDRPKNKHYERSKDRFQK